MSDRVARRSSYGPSSPHVGARGAATRQRIVDGSLAVFSEHGYHETVVEDLAEAVGLSRAALYQYFKGKEEIFVEIVEASGAAILDTTRSIGKLGPDPAGFANLRRWLLEWSRVFARYQAAFVQWADVDSPTTPLRPRMRKFVTAYTDLLAAALADARTDIDPIAGAITVSAVIERYAYVRAVHDVGISEQTSAEALALALQTTLFPGTPADALDVEPAPPDPPTGAMPAMAPASDRFAGNSPQARETAERVLEVAAREFAEHGEEGTNVDRIARAAGVSRGTIYKYYGGSQDLFGELARRCGHDLTLLCGALGAINPADSSALRAWLSAFTTHHQRYAGVLRAWTRNSITDSRVLDARAAVLRQALHGFSRLRSHGGDAMRPGRDAAGLMFISSLEWTPEVARGAKRPPSRPELIDAQALFIERGLLGVR